MSKFVIVWKWIEHWNEKKKKEKSFVVVMKMVVAVAVAVVGVGPVSHTAGLLTIGLLGHLIIAHRCRQLWSQKRRGRYRLARSGSR